MFVKCKCRRAMKGGVPFSAAAWGTAPSCWPRPSCSRAVAAGVGVGHVGHCAQGSRQRCCKQIMCRGLGHSRQPPAQLQLPGISGCQGRKQKDGRGAHEQKFNSAPAERPHRRTCRRRRGRRGAAASGAAAAVLCAPAAQLGNDLSLLGQQPGALHVAGQHCLDGRGVVAHHLCRGVGGGWGGAKRWGQAEGWSASHSCAGCAREEKTGTNSGVRAADTLPHVVGDLA